MRHVHRASFRAVNCRVGSLEISADAGIPDAGVNCRVGSLENKEPLPRNAA